MTSCGLWVAAHDLGAARGGTTQRRSAEARSLINIFGTPSAQTVATSRRQP